MRPRSSRTCRSRIWPPPIPRPGDAPHELFYRVRRAGAVFIYPFGAIVFRDLPPAARERELERLRRARPGLTAATVIEELTVREDPGRPPDVAEGVLTLDQLTPERASVVALTVAQSAAMEYYERIVEEMFARTDQLVQRLEKQGTVLAADPAATPVHRRRHLDAQRGAHRSCTCSTSRTRPGTTPG